MANNSKEVYGSLTTKDTLPLSTSTAVTITASTGTDKFTISAAITDDFKVGSWIWDTANDELYKVKQISADGTYGVIWGTFNDTLSTGAMDYIKSQDTKVVQMALEAVADSTVNGVSLPTGNTLNFTSSGISAKFGTRWVDPKIIDGATGEVRYILTKW
jgi:hypothetical protein